MSARSLRLAFAATAALICASCSPYDFTGTGAKPDAAADRQDQEARLACAELRPWMHFLQTDRRGEYDPVLFDLPKEISCKGDRSFPQIGVVVQERTEIGQSFDRNLILKTPSCARLAAPDLKLTADLLLECQLDLMIDGFRRFLSKPGKEPETRFLYVHIHGGLNDAKSRTTRAVHDMPLMMLDCRSAKDTSCEPRTRASDEIYFPIFVAWPSGGWDTYSDSIANYDQGQWDNFQGGWPFRLFSDLGSAVVRAPLTYLKSFRRSLDSENEATLGADTAKFDTFGCPSPEYPGPPFPRYECENSAPQQAGTLSDAAYYLAFPVRAVTTPFVDPLGKTAWDSMIARTRFAFRKPGPAWHERDMRTDANRDGVVVKLFQKLNAIDQSETPFLVRLTGHSMGAIVASEIVRTFPRIPYDAITFMGAAVNIREFKTSVEPYLDSINPAEACAGDKPRFFNLSLQPEAEMKERFGVGLTMSGSLLEWIDDMYEKPGDLMDRTLGRWRNVVTVREAFRTGAAPCIHFKRFGWNWQSPVKHGAFDDIRTCTIEGSAEKRFLRPFYWEHAFWRTDGFKTDAVKISQKSGEALGSLKYWRKSSERHAPSACVDDQTGVRLVPDS